MSKLDLRFRQVHLDFHTSEAITEIGVAFDAEEFAAILEQAHVDSVTCFARCHHGWMYYDSKAFPERVHPHLVQRNLLQEQIEACHERDIRVPIYITIQWDHYTANKHPEWRVLSPDGSLEGTPPYEAGFYRRLCLNTPYVDFVKAHVQEVLESLPVDGFFFDIVAPMDCSCRYCRDGMQAEGLDPSDEEARLRYGLGVVNRFKRNLTGVVRQFNSECTIFYNAGHVSSRHRGVVDAYTHFEIESLPSGGWGYLHFPMTVRYARNLGLGCLGMTGKFHTSWGDFHSFKSRAALEFECFQMLAQGASCSVGDQLHPSGRIDPHVYGLIGSVYGQVAQKEPWCRGAEPVTEIGVFGPDEFYGSAIGRLPPTLMGATRMLEQAGYQFDILDSHSPIERYKVLILPDDIPVNEALAARIDAHLAQGGAVIASYKAGLNPAGTAFATEGLGVTLKGDAPFSPDFLLPREAIGQALPDTEHVMYLRGLEIETRPNSTVLADVVVPYFDRTYAHFCSHRHTPSSGQVAYAGIVRSGNAIYFGHPIFTQYNQNAPQWCQKLFLNALDLLLPQPILRHSGPSTLLATVTEQRNLGRWVLHLLHYIPERRGQDFDTIEDVIALYNVKLSLQTPKAVSNVTLVPQETALVFTLDKGRLEFLVPKIEGHQMIELGFVA